MLRGVVQCLVYIWPVWYKRIPLFGTGPKDLMWLIARGVVGFMAFLFMFFTVSLLPYSDGVTLIQSAPVYTAIFAALLLGERCGLLQIMTIIGTLVGVCLIARPEFLFAPETEALQMDATRMMGVACGFFAALVLGGTFVIVRKLREMPSDLVLLWFSIVSLVLGGALYGVAKYVLVVEGLRMPESFYEWSVCLTTTIFCVLQQSVLVYSLKIEEANVFALVKSSEIILGFMCQALFLSHETIESTSLLGALIIFMAVMISILRRLANDGKNKLEWLRRLVPGTGTGSSESIAQLPTGIENGCCPERHQSKLSKQLSVVSQSLSIAALEAATSKLNSHQKKSSLSNVLITVDPLDLKCPNCKCIFDISATDKL